jgi:maleate isomerase
MNRRDFLSTLGLGSGTLLSLPEALRAAQSDRSTWQSDGSGWRARIGVLTPHFDPVPESEFWTMAPQGVSVHAARVLFVDSATFASPPYVDDATELLATIPVHAIVFAFTTSSYLLGAEGEQAMKARLEKRSKGIPVLLPCVAAVTALRVLGVRRIALIHPPWFADDVNQAGGRYFQGRGFDVACASQLKPSRKFTEVDPAELYEWVRKQVPTAAEAVFIGGNGLRAIGAISALEKDLGRPVLSANQAALWCVLRQVGVGAPVNGYGQVFKKHEFGK